MMAARRGKRVFSSLLSSNICQTTKSQSPTVYEKPSMKTNLIAAESAANDDDDNNDDDSSNNYVDVDVHVYIYIYYSAIYYIHTCTCIHTRSYTYIIFNDCSQSP